jgi:hypothetical protein
VYTGLPKVSAPKRLHRSTSSNTASNNQAQGHYTAPACVLLPLLLHTCTGQHCELLLIQPSLFAAAAAASNASKPRYSEDQRHCT